MMVVVEERTREIGIKLAVGARRRTILRQFFTESLFLMLFGGAAGFALSAVVIRVTAVPGADHGFRRRPRLNPLVAISTVGILLVIGTSPA